MSGYIEDLRIGNTKTLVIDYGAGVDITGWIFHFILKENLNDTTNILKVTVTSGTDARDDILNGLCYVAIPSDFSVAVGKYYWSLQVDKLGSPKIVETILPPLCDLKDRVKVVEAMDIT